MNCDDRQYSWQYGFSARSALPADVAVAGGDRQGGPLCRPRRWRRARTRHASFSGADSRTFVGASRRPSEPYWALSRGLTWLALNSHGHGLLEKQAGFVSVCHGYRRHVVIAHSWIHGDAGSAFTTRAERGVLGAATLV